MSDCHTAGFPLVVLLQVDNVYDQVINKSRTLNPQAELSKLKHESDAIALHDKNLNELLNDYKTLN